MAGLLVSVRSAREALVAASAGVAVVDVKEPSRGPLGASDPRLWREVRAAIGPGRPLSVALGELAGPIDLGRDARAAIGVVDFVKIGLAGVGPGWADEWARLRGAIGDGPRWVAVAYADWADVGAPPPDAVLAEAARAGASGVLVDTHRKGVPSPIGPAWSPWIGRARAAGLTVALAGGLEAADIRRLASAAPDLFAVRGAACVGGDRLAEIDPDRVAALSQLVSQVSEPNRGLSARSR